MYAHGRTNSGVYTLYDSNGHLFKVFCQFNASALSGYTFLSRDAIALHERYPLDLTSLYNDRSHIVLRVFESNGSQSHIRVDNMGTYASQDMTFMLNAHTAFGRPGGIPELGPYLFVGLPGPPRSSHALLQTSGFKANAVDYTWICTNTQYYQIVQFPNRFASSVESTGDESSSLTGWLSGRVAVTQDAVIETADDFRSVTELQFGSDSCGLHSIIQNWNSVSGTAIGLPFSKLCLTLKEQLTWFCNSTVKTEIYGIFYYRNTTQLYNSREAGKYIFTVVPLFYNPLFKDPLDYKTA